MQRFWWPTVARFYGYPLNRQPLQIHRSHCPHLTGPDSQLMRAIRTSSRRWYLPLVSGALFCETAWLVSIAPTDVTHYACYGLTFWLGSSATLQLPQGWCTFLHVTTAQPALYMLPLEYPPLTILPFS